MVILIQIQQDRRSQNIAITGHIADFRIQRFGISHLDNQDLLHGCPLKPTAEAMVLEWPTTVPIESAFRDSTSPESSNRPVQASVVHRVIPKRSPLLAGQGDLSPDIFMASTDTLFLDTLLHRSKGDHFPIRLKQIPNIVAVSVSRQVPIPVASNIRIFQTLPQERSMWILRQIFDRRIKSYILSPIHGGMDPIGILGVKIEQGKSPPRSDS